jgi:DNA polymerase
MVVGEAPGRIEDRENLPFVGPAGLYLRRSLVRAGLDERRGIYLNVVSCWPHGSPTQAHIDACRGNLYDQLQADDTRFVLVCGTVALKSLLPQTEMKYVMGRAIDVHGKTIFPVQHPSFVAFKSTSRDTVNNWRTMLERFARLAQGLEIDQFTTCIYCDRRAVERDGKLEYYCPKHKSLWRKDSFWKPASVQKRLF